MATNYVKPGESRTWTNTTGSTIAKDSVVKMSHQLGIALSDIPNNTSGEVALVGVWTVPKVSGAVFVAGEKLLGRVGWGV